DIHIRHEHDEEGRGCRAAADLEAQPETAASPRGAQVTPQAELEGEEDEEAAVEQIQRLSAPFGEQIGPYPADVHPEDCRRGHPPRDRESHESLLGFSADSNVEAHPGRAEVAVAATLHPTIVQIARAYARARQEIRDPTTLIIIDEADCLNMAGLDQIREIF